MYAYCGNNPVNHVDFSGEFFFSITISGALTWKIAVVLVTLIASVVIIDSVSQSHQTTQPISSTKAETRMKSDSEKKHIVSSVPKNTIEEKTIIYRYGGYILPLENGESKGVWENCARALYEISDERLEKHLPSLLEWLEDLNWPGALIILERLKKFSGKN